MQITRSRRHRPNRRLHIPQEGCIAALTAREEEVLSLIADGRSNREIADEMHLAEKTVKNYVSNLLTKMGMSRRTEAAVYAARLQERKKP